MGQSEKGHANPAGARRTQRGHVVRVEGQKRGAETQNSAELVRNVS